MHLPQYRSRSHRIPVFPSRRAKRRIHLARASQQRHVHNIRVLAVPCSCPHRQFGRCNFQHRLRNFVGTLIFRFVRHPVRQRHVTRYLQFQIASSRQINLRFRERWKRRAVRQHRQIAVRIPGGQMLQSIGNSSLRSVGCIHAMDNSVLHLFTRVVDFQQTRRDCYLLSVRHLQTFKLYPQRRRLVHHSHSHFRDSCDFAFQSRPHGNLFRTIARRRFDHHRMNLVARFSAIRRQRLQQSRPKRLSSFQGIALREHRRTNAKEGKCNQSQRTRILHPFMLPPLLRAQGTLHNFSCLILCWMPPSLATVFHRRTVLKSSPATCPVSSFPCC